MRIATAQKVIAKSQIDWELIRRRMTLLKYQPGYFTEGPTPPVDNWILTYGVWNDAGVWQDDDVWKDS
jgi:hypothetical protein